MVMLQTVCALLPGVVLLLAVLNSGCTHVRRGLAAAANRVAGVRFCCNKIAEAEAAVSVTKRSG